MNRLLSYTLFFVILFFQAPAFSAKTTRSCTAKYMLHIHHANQQHGGPIAKKEMSSFTAKGRCGKTVPNRCRERAQAAALVCMEFHYNNDFLTTYTNNKAPYYCSTYRNIRGYHIGQLATKIRQTACGAIAPRSGTFKVKVISRVHGKNKCAVDKPLRRQGTQYPGSLPLRKYSSRITLER